MTKKEVKELLDSEIAWCRFNPRGDLADDYQRGFIAGLEQAKRIVRNAAKSA